MTARASPTLAVYKTRFWCAFLCTTLGTPPSVPGSSAAESLLDPLPLFIFASTSLTFAILPPEDESPSASTSLLSFSPLAEVNPDRAFAFEFEEVSSSSMRRKATTAVQPEWVFSASASLNSSLSTARNVSFSRSGMGRSLEEEPEVGGLFKVSSRYYRTAHGVGEKQANSARSSATWPARTTVF
jgi:hypothetical protein